MLKALYVWGVGGSLLCGNCRCQLLLHLRKHARISMYWRLAPIQS